MILFLVKTFSLRTKPLLTLEIRYYVYLTLLSNLLLRNDSLFVSTVSDVCISAKTTVAVQTKLPEFNENSDLFVEGGFSEDTQLFIARILTKVRPHSNKITVQVTNLSDRSVYLPKCTDIAEVTPVVEQRDSCAEDTHVAAVFTDRDASSDILSEDDLKIDHLEREQRDRLVDLL